MAPAPCRQPAITLGPSDGATGIKAQALHQALLGSVWTYRPVDIPAPGGEVSVANSTSLPLFLPHAQKSDGFPSMDINVDYLQPLPRCADGHLSPRRGYTGAGLSEPATGCNPCNLVEDLHTAHLAAQW